MLSIIPKNINEARDAFTSLKLLPSVLVKHYLEVIAETNPQINAVLEVFDDCLEDAKIADENFKNSTARPLEGVPFLIKDCILTKGHTASAGSKMLENYIADRRPARPGRS